MKDRDVADRPITTCSTAVDDDRFRAKRKLNGRENRLNLVEFDPWRT